MTIISLITFISIYLISDKLSNYTLLSNYSWYDNLSMKLYDYKGKFKSLLTKIYYFKLFTCRSCNVFWISLLIYSLLNLVSLSILPILSSNILSNPLVASLITFLIHKSESNV